MMASVIESIGSTTLRPPAVLSAPLRLNPFEGCLAANEAE
jgi:hypothetical protein